MKSPQLPHLPFTRVEGAAIGITRPVLDRLVRDGTVTKLRSNLYWSTHVAASMDPLQRHAVLARSVVKALRSEFVIARESAAVIHGLAIPTPLRNGPQFVTVVASASSRSERVEGLRIWRAALTDRDVVDVDGVFVTSIARTAMDLARGRALPRALVATDSARRLGAARGEMIEVRDRFFGFPGTRFLSSAIMLSNPLSESPLESISRGVIHEAGLKAPELQVRVNGHSGKEYRADLFWSESGVVGEADGLTKYGSREDLVAEKRREDDLRRAGFIVIRWTMDEILRRPSPVVDRLRPHVGRG